MKNIHPRRKYIEISLEISWLKYGGFINLKEVFKITESKNMIRRDFLHLVLYLLTYFPLFSQEKLSQKPLNLT
jgi:hypothetical protein